VPVFVVDALEAVAVDQQQAAALGDVGAATLLQVQVEAAAVRKAGEFVGARELFGLREAMVGRAQRVERGLQVEVAAAQVGRALQRGGRRLARPGSSGHRVEVAGADLALVLDRGEALLGGGELGFCCSSTNALMLLRA
jgi:hypothetical protein